MRNPRPRGTAVLVVGLLLAAVAVGCTVTPPDLDPVSGPQPYAATAGATTGTAPGAPTGDPGRHAAPPAPSRPRAVASPMGARGGDSAAHAEPDCAARDLGLGGNYPRKAVLGNPGDEAMDILLSNRSGAACLLRGWPGITFYGENTILHCDAGCNDDGFIDPVSPRPLSVTRYGPSRPAAVDLAPGQSTTFSLVWKSATETVCTGEDFYNPPYGAHVLVPGDSAALDITPLDISPCRGRIAVTPFGVSG
ncbi:DUF4232 domain-containing protein [Streptomyces sp. NPDC058691]|uniref:DUF4232 domain-containing protein n=1 Tax=Streptomyces sp. NPDC058691 TaxID=3346601 RepID=UPI003658ABDD